MRDIDNSLLQQGWQDQLFISEQTLVFVYLLANNSGSGTAVSHVTTSMVSHDTKIVSGEH